MLKFFYRRLFRRYCLFLIVVLIILSIQIFLAYSFYNIYSGNEEEYLIKGNPGKTKLNSQIQQGNIYVDPAFGKLLEDYVIDDEDAPSNLFFKGLKDSSSRNGPVLQNAAVHDSEGNLQSNNKTDTNSRLNLDELDFSPTCNISAREAISSIHRAPTQKCKQEIANITCLIQDGMLYPRRLPRYCPLDAAVKAGEDLGCYKDHMKKRILPEYVARLTDNSPSRCIDLCQQSGFQLAGVQFRNECFCGRTVPSTKVQESYCNMSCPKNSSLRCGGYLTMNVYRTGLPKPFKHEPQMPDGVNTVDDIKIVFLLTVNGRAVRQIRRLIKALYHTKHYFYIHVDSRQIYLFRELLVLEKLPNIRLSRNRLSTIWGGASLLQMLLQCISELLLMKDWKWDYFINLSESDFPIKSLSKLEMFLSANHGMNFVKSHGQDTQRFIAKQGLDKTFYECDTHMWRLGPRTLPWGIRMDGGSDWVALNRDFCSYVIFTDNELLRGLKVVFQYTLLPAESFFHTALQNSEFCTRAVDNNLHITNWKRKQGCKCQYKHIVDWCGCSPNNFRNEDWPRLQSTEARPFFFARKFEPSVSQDIIDQVEQWIGGTRQKDMPGVSSYWQNEYHHQDISLHNTDAFLTMYESFRRLALKQLFESLNSCVLTPGKVLESTLYFEQDVFKGTLVLYHAELPGVKAPVLLETEVRPVQHYTVHHTMGSMGRLKFLQVGSDFDTKEQVFRNFGRILGPYSEPGALHKWGSGQGFSATFVWVDPTNVVAGSYEVKIESGMQALYHKPTFRQPLRPGIWSLLLLYNWKLVAKTTFLVTPLAVHFGHAVSAEQGRFLHSGPGQPYVDHDFSNVETLLGYTNRSALARQALANSRRFGTDLTDWIDSLASKFWTVQTTCFVAQPTHPTGGALCPQLDIDPCHETTWSSKSPDPKSSIGSVDHKSGKLS